MELRWLREYGLIASLDDYWGLPISVLEDAQLLMRAEYIKLDMEHWRG